MTQQLQPASRKPDKRRKYDEAFKAEALRLATESRSTRAAARQLGISKKLLYRWQQARTVAEASSTGMARDPEVRALRAANKRLAQEVDILKSLGHLRPADPVSVYQHIATCQPQQPVRRLCQVLGASPTYYAWQAQQRAPVPAVETAVVVIFTDHALASMSRKGNCYDNAHAESLWRRLKTELLDGGSFPDLETARLKISHSGAYYNLKRRPSAPEYQAPANFETLRSTTS